MARSKTTRPANRAFRKDSPEEIAHLAKLYLERGLPLRPEHKAYFAKVGYPNAAPPASTVPQSLAPISCKEPPAPQSPAAAPVSPWDRPPSPEVQRYEQLRAEAQATRQAPLQGAPVQDVLLSYDDVRQAIEALQKDDPAALKSVITKIAKARLTTIEEDLLCKLVKNKIGGSIYAVKRYLKDAQDELIEPQTPQPPQPIGAPVNWRLKLVLDDRTKDPKAIITNIFLPLMHDINWTGVLAMNDFTHEIALRRPPPWHKGAFTERPLTDADIRYTTLWMQENGIHVSSRIVFEAMQAAAERASFNPPLDYLSKLIWDRQPRIDDLFVSYFNAKIDPGNERLFAYYRAIGGRSMIAAVARIFDPGCKNDTTPNLFGPQGCGKSTAVETLFSPWYTDDLAEMGSKDSQMQVAGVWGVEVGEMVAARRDTDKTKAFISRRTDRFRAPYGRMITKQPRQCVFWGTTNRDIFLFDETGNRRSWGVACGAIDTARLKADKDMLWAEAVARYRATPTEKYWLHEPELIETAAEVQSNFAEQDAWHQTVTNFVTGRTEVTVDEALTKIDVKLQDRTQAHANRVSKILKMEGWERGWRGKDRCYRKPTV